MASEGSRNSSGYFTSRGKIAACHFGTGGKVAQLQFCLQCQNSLTLTLNPNRGKVATSERLVYCEVTNSTLDIETSY